MHELKHHPTCLTDLFNRETSRLKSLEKSSCRSEAEPDIYPLVLSELVNYMVETSLSLEGPAIFPLADISQLYKQRLKQLEIDSPSVNKTRLKEKLLMEMHELEGHKKEELFFQHYRKLLLYPCLRHLNTQMLLFWPKLQRY